MLKLPANLASFAPTLLPLLVAMLLLNPVSLPVVLVNGLPMLIAPDGVVVPPAVLPSFLTLDTKLTVLSPLLLHSALPLPQLRILRLLLLLSQPKSLPPLQPKDLQLFLPLLQLP